MTTTARAALRAARRARGWSQTDAARELAALARAAGGPVAAPASLKSLLSRWENGHASPDPAYRALLAELYGRTAAELDLVSGAGDGTEGAGSGGAAARLRARLAAAQAVDGRLLGVWADQLAVARRLDEEAGTAGAAGLTRALVEELEHTFAHAVDPSVRAAVGLALARAAILAGWQELDRGDPERAWGRFVTARAAAALPFGPGGAGHAAPSSAPRISGTDAEEAMAEATAGMSTVLVDIGDPGSALALIGHAPAAISGGARAWLEAARGAAEAARGRAAQARRGFDAAQRALSEGGPAPDHDVRHHDTSGAPGAVAAAGSRFDELRRQRGQALAALGEPGAVSDLEAALAAGVRSVRARAATHAALAVALPADPAAEHARAARMLAERTGSARTVALLTAARPTGYR